MVLGSPVVQNHIFKSALESEVHVEFVTGLVLSFLIRPVFGKRQLQVDVALGIEGKDGGGIAAFSGPARRTKAGVGVLSIIGQQGDATCFVLTLVLAAANQTEVTVLTTPRLLARLWFGAMTLIGVGSIFTNSAILARITVTLVDVHFTVYTCMEKPTFSATSYSNTTTTPMKPKNILNYQCLTFEDIFIINLTT